jgi:hypothetical protein
VHLNKGREERRKIKRTKRRMKLKGDGIFHRMVKKAFFSSLNIFKNNFYHLLLYFRNEKKGFFLILK